MVERRKDYRGYNRWWPHLVQIIVFLFIVGVAWGTIGTKVARLEHDMTLKASKEQMDTRFDAILRELDQIEKLIRDGR